VLAAIELDVAAAATLLGAVLGVGLGGLITYLLERRREKARARAGARLVRHDLAHAADHLREAQEQGVWRAFWITRVEHWNEYRDLLAEHLDTVRWETVAEAVGDLRHIQVEMKELELVAGETRYVQISDQGRERVMAGRKEACLAYNALAKLAGGDEVEQLGASPRPSLAARTHADFRRDVD
jgi:hypothetical protein